MTSAIIFFVSESNSSSGSGVSDEIHIVISLLVWVSPLGPVELIPVMHTTNYKRPGQLPIQA